VGFNLNIKRVDTPTTPLLPVFHISSTAFPQVFHRFSTGYAQFFNSFSTAFQQDIHSFSTGVNILTFPGGIVAYFA
jgi:hypothetical protein